MTDKSLHVYGREDEPPNGKKWWRETWGKIVAGVAAPVIVAVLWWTWGRAVDLTTATAKVYSLPPRVERLEAQVNAAPVLTPSQVQRLTSVLERVERQQQEKPKR